MQTQDFWRDIVQSRTAGVYCRCNGGWLEDRRNRKQPPARDTNDRHDGLRRECLCDSITNSTNDDTGYRISKWFRKEFAAPSAGDHTCDFLLQMESVNM